MAKVELKQPIVDEIKQYAEQASSAILVDFRGLTVEQDTRLRKNLREAGVVYKVYKNTMLHLAFEGTDFAQLDPHLEGPSAIAFGMDDATAPARIIKEFSKEAPSFIIACVSKKLKGENLNALESRMCKAFFSRFWRLNPEMRETYARARAIASMELHANKLP